MFWDTPPPEPWRWLGAANLGSGGCLQLQAQPRLTKSEVATYTALETVRTTYRSTQQPGLSWLLQENSSSRSRKASMCCSCQSYVDALIAAPGFFSRWPLDCPTNRIACLFFEARPQQAGVQQHSSSLAAAPTSPTSTPQKKRIAAVVGSTPTPCCPYNQ